LPLLLLLLPLLLLLLLQVRGLPGHLHPHSGI
jgi:hypothetical protein